MKVEPNLTLQIEQSVRNLERLLSFWQEKVETDDLNNREYAFPHLVKQLMIEYQEYLYVMQKVWKILNPAA